MDVKNYQVSYVIDVQASDGVKEVMNFAKAVETLSKTNSTFTGVANNINNMMAKVDEVFRTKNGKKRDYAYKMSIDTGSTEEKLGRVKNLLLEIRELTKGVSLTINAGQTLDSKAVKAKTKDAVNKKLSQQHKEAVEKDAASSVKTMADCQKRVTKSIGKINSALVSMEKGREVNIKTDVAKRRLQELLKLLKEVKGLSDIPVNIQAGVPGKGKSGASAQKYVGAASLYHPDRIYTLPPKVAEKLRQKLGTNQVLNKQRADFARARNEETLRTRRELEAVRGKEWDRRRSITAEAALRKQAQAQEKQQGAVLVRGAQRQSLVRDQMYGSRRKAAINRIQYSRMPSLQSIPFVSMMNAYMAYGFIKSELAKALEYSNIMTSARSILKVADTDLTTFGYRFDQMAGHVRRIGIETKFTAVEIAGAVKYLSMAGMGIDTINKSIGAVTNLALIGDNDVSQVADLATNIMAGYNIKNDSMDSVADILASTVSRSNVNIVETAESFKMAAGYLRMAGVDFSESSAAIGILGNSGIKGTMGGTALRAMSTRFAKPTRESQKVLDRLGIKFTEFRDIYGKQVEKLRPLADIFEDLNKKGATMGDMQALFGKIGGNAAMMLLKNHAKLRELTSQNRASHGISTELAKVKQGTAKGLWAQVTSQLTESFMQGYELIEPLIKSTLRNFLSRFNAREFSRGIAAIGQTLLDLFSVIGKIGTWVTRNYSWLEPLFFTGFVGIRIYKLAAAVTNLGVAIGFLGKQSAAGSVLQLLGGLTGGMGGKGMTFANKRAIVAAMSGAGISGKGAMRNALMGMGVGGASTLIGKGGFLGLFSNQVATGGGMIGATASLSSLGGAAIAATAGVAALVGMLGWVAYKTWKVKEAKDAVQEDITANEKYRYPSIEALYESLRAAHKQAVDTKKAVNDVTAGKSLEEVSGQKIGAFTGNWWRSVFSGFAASSYRGYRPVDTPVYTTWDAYQDDTRAAILTVARKDSQERVNSALADLGKKTTGVEVSAFMQTLKEKYGQQESSLNHSLWTEKNGKAIYKPGIDKLTALQAVGTKDYYDYQNTVTVKDIMVIAEAYRRAIGSYEGASYMLTHNGFGMMDKLAGMGFTRGEDGLWKQKALGKDATDKEREQQLVNRDRLHLALVTTMGVIRDKMGGSAEMAENIVKAAGFSPHLYSNEPDFDDMQPFNASGITYSGADDGMAGGNYSGSGKLSSAAPKQVIVNISSLMSIGTIDLMKTPEGQQAEMQNLKEQLAQVLIDVVHEFDQTWHG